LTYSRTWLLFPFVVTTALALHAQTIRLDDRLNSAVIHASGAAGNAIAAAPVTWENFFSKADIRWQLVRGRIGVRNGDLMVEGQGFTPVILAPAQPAVDWSLYQSVEIRMSAAAGREIKIKVGSFEAHQNLGPPNQYNIYKFPIEIHGHGGTQPLGIMPTDSLDQPVAIRSVKLVPKTATFVEPSGRTLVGKRDDYRQAIYIHSPSDITFPVVLPPEAHLHMSLSKGNEESAVRFLVAIDKASNPVFSRSLASSDSWQDVDVDLTRWSKQRVQIRLHTESDKPGAVALWANPIITGTSPDRRPNILIYTIDTVRADHASVYGYSRATTPFLKKLAATGAVFTDCQAQATSTKPSIASLMTSLNSFAHGIVSDSDTIPAGSVTLAQQLHSAGYVTASIVASPFVGRTTGLERGFSYLLEDPVIRREVNPANDGATDSAALNRVIFRWLDQHSREPFFLYAHATDPHAPYNAPSPFDRTFGKLSTKAPFEKQYASLRSDREHGGGAVFDREMCRKAGIAPDPFIQTAQDQYDAEILHNDTQFGVLFEKLRTLGMLENTLVIVLSDHGEEFWDHGWSAHGHTVYEELAHTLLLMWNPRLLGAPRSIQEPVQLIDVMPTVLNLLNLQVPPVAEGQTLVPLIKGQPWQRRGLIVSSRFALTDHGGVAPESSTDSFAIIDSHWKFIYRKNSAQAGLKKVELYDRTIDRTEQHDIAVKNPAEVEAKMTALRQWVDGQNKLRQVIGHAGTTQLDQKTLDRLRSLGYLGGASQ
jgi:arylsulfatase A-like enzyme